MQRIADRVLIVAAHPDDEVLGPGGTVKRLVDLGARALIVIACTGRPGHEAAVEDSARQVGGMLGADDVVFLRFPNLRLESFPLVEVVRRLEQIIASFRPTTVFTHHGGDVNRDHQVCFRATVTATRPLRECPVRALLCFETPSSTEWSVTPTDAFHPNVFVDITDTFPAKMQALAAYRSEMRPYPFPRSLQGVEALARTRGTTIGVTYAEAFQLMRGIWA